MFSIFKNCLTKYLVPSFSSIILEDDNEGKMSSCFAKSIDVII
jgi:hypothetical protein